MEVEEIQTQGPPSSKFPRLIANGGRSADPTTTVKLGHHGEQDGDLSHLRGWHHHSRIIRVSRASGGKDRHSKVLTSKGLRDRRVRLSVSTAIQFYDIQDRLGYDQPSKAVEWLIKAASDSISELPSLSSNFPDTPKQLSDEKRGSEELDEYHHHQHGQQQHQQQHQQQQHNLSLSKSACSSTSETSKGSGGLSLSRTEIRVNRVKKSRERARERTAKDKEKETPATGSQQQQPHQEISLTPMSQSSSFTELLTGPGPHGGRGHQWISASPSSSMDYFQQHQQQQSGFVGIPGQTISIPQFTISGEHSHHNHHHQHQQELQHFSFDHINLIPVTPASEYNLNFTISPSSGLAGYRGTLQSNNTASLLPQHHQRFSSTTTSPTVDGSNNSSNNMPFFLSPSPMENHHHHHHQQQLHIGQFPSGLQLYGDGTTRHSPDHKGKVKN